MLSSTSRSTHLRLLMLLTLISCTVMVAPAQIKEVVLHNFPGPAPHGSDPTSGVVLDSAGNFYGTTQYGGAHDLGTVFKIDASSKLTVLHSFGGGTDGVYPETGVTLDSAGNLYGTTREGGTNGDGTLYKLDPSGNETVLFNFGGGPGAGANPNGVALDAAGNIYGTTVGGGGLGYGILYELTASGSFILLHQFAGTDGGEPSGPVILDSAGNLYGVTGIGGAQNLGAVYKLDSSGTLTILLSFDGSDGSYPSGGLIFDSAGNLYGTTALGGPAGCGAVYKLDPSGEKTVLYGFTSGDSGCEPSTGVVRDSAGNLYGTTYLGGAYGGGIAFKLDPHGNATVLYNFQAPQGVTGVSGLVLGTARKLYGTTRFGGGAANLGMVFEVTSSGIEKALYSFSGPSDGAQPSANLTRDTQGNLYGTTVLGGTAELGTVFKLSPAGVETILHTFTGLPDGESPASGLTLDAAGNLYGTAGGGAFGFGAIYKIDPSGNETVLYSFGSGPNSPTNPDSNVVIDSAGNLYGTTDLGGTFNEGALYKLDPSGNLTVLRSFDAVGAGGYYPGGNLVLDSEGNIYGATSFGGIYGAGVIYKLDPSGTETVLHSFTGGYDGYGPSGLVRDAAGNLYGVTALGGGSGFNEGTVFKLPPNGTLKVLYTFARQGAYPNCCLAIDPAGDLFGTTSQGGAYGGGVAFEVSATGAFRVLHAFHSGAGGEAPHAGLILGPTHTLYGAATYGGALGGGTVFELEN